MTQQTTPKASLFGALARSQKRCRAAELDGRFESKNARYPFTSTNERLAVARDALSEEGLALVRVGKPRLTEVAAQRELVITETGEVKVEQWPQRMLEADYLLTHESGESLELGVTWPVCEGPGRGPDKAWASADTSALGYLIRDVLLIPSEESEDLREREGSGGRITQMPSRPAPPPVPPAPKTQPAATGPAGHPGPTAATTPAATDKAAGPATPTSPTPTSSSASPVPAEPVSTQPVPPGPPVQAQPDVFDEAVASDGAMTALVELEKSCKAKLAAAPIAGVKLFALEPSIQDKPLWLEVFAVASKRLGSKEAAIAKAKESGIQQGTVPTIAQLRQYVERLP